jgi:hypothetical protein
MIKAAEAVIREKFAIAASKSRIADGTKFSMVSSYGSMIAVGSFFSVLDRLRHRSSYASGGSILHVPNGRFGGRLPQLGRSSPRNAIMATAL